MPRMRRGMRIFPSFVLLVSVGIVACDKASRSTPPDGKRPVDSSVSAVDKTQPKAEQSPSRIDQSSAESQEPIEARSSFGRLRPDDRRAKHDEGHLRANGIQIFESKRLKLYTDIEPELARSLPDLIDQAYVAMEKELGPLPPDRAGTDFQMTGCVIRNMMLFRKLNLMPTELMIEHGLHRGQEFWMRDQTSDYYRRHLLIHEATHCFMTIMPGTDAPPWYLEGMAEFFATHRLSNDGQVTFGVVPESTFAYPGFGRIELVRDAVDSDHSQSLAAVLNVSPIAFRATRHYAFAWALCTFFNKTPRYVERFRKLADFTQDGRFQAEFDRLFAPDERDLMTEWRLCSANLQYGYDFERAGIDFQAGTSLTDEKSQGSVGIAAERGWQSSRIQLEAGHTYEVDATGQFTLADQPKPWVSEPQGISFQYFEGRPIGTLLGCVRAEEGPAGDDRDSMLEVFPIGRSARIQAKHSGTLYLRLNDAWNSLRDNRGHVDVTVRRALAP